MIFAGQCVLVGIVIFVLKRLLDKELVQAALEGFESCKAPSDIKEIDVFSASRISDELKSHLESVRQCRFVQANLNFKENADLRGGLIIALGDIVLDFSLASRLENFWS